MAAVLFLAIAVGGGAAIAIIGGGGRGGGGDGALLDAITGNGSSTGGTGADRYKKQEASALAKLKTNPKDIGAYETLITARIQLAGLDGHYDANTDTYDEAGKAELRQATDAWEAYQKLDPPNSEAEGSTANRIAGAYLQLNQPQKLAEALEVFAEIRNTTGPYQQLAQVAFQLGQTRKGQLAADKAVELAPPDQKQSVKADMEQLAQSAAPSTTTVTVTPTPTETPTATATPKTTAKPKSKAKGKSGKQ